MTTDREWLLKTLPDTALPPGAWAPVVVVAATLWGEARGEAFRTRLAVGMVIRNRALSPGWWGTDWKSVCLKRWQFSCWNEGDPNRVKMIRPLANGTPELWLECLALASVLIGTDPETLPDLTGGATHYFDKSLDGREPSWAASMRRTLVAGRLRFYGPAGASRTPAEPPPGTAGGKTEGGKGEQPIMKGPSFDNLRMMLNQSHFIGRDSVGRLVLPSSPFPAGFPGVEVAASKRQHVAPETLLGALAKNKLRFDRGGTLELIFAEEGGNRSSFEVAHHLCFGLPYLWLRFASWEPGQKLAGMTVKAPYRDGSVVIVEKEAGEHPVEDPGDYRWTLPDNWELLRPVLEFGHRRMNWQTQAEPSDAWKEIQSGGLEFYSGSGSGEAATKADLEAVKAELLSAIRAS